MSRIGEPPPIGVRVCSDAKVCGRANVKPLVYGSLTIEKYAFEEVKMRLPGSVHKKTNLLNGIGNIWPRKGKVL